jgi:hypothetical protein
MQVYAKKTSSGGAGTCIDTSQYKPGAKMFAIAAGSQQYSIIHAKPLPAIWIPAPKRLHLT